MMPEVADVFAALRRQGVAAYRLDAATVRLVPGTAVTPELAAMIRAAKPALLPLLPPVPGSPAVVDYDAIYAALAAEVAAGECGAAIQRHTELNGAWVIDEIRWLDHRCDRLARAGVDAATYRAAVILLVARLEELCRWYLGAVPSSAARHLAIESSVPQTTPVALPDGTEVAHPGRFAGRLLTAIDYLRAQSLPTDDGVLDVYLSQLAAVGIRARLEGPGGDR